MKKIIIIGLAAVSLVTIGCTNTQTSNTDPSYWQKEAPQLFNNVGYANLQESIPAISKSESTNSLIGSITNPFGIRDDILEHIIKTIPNNNESAMKAAIKMMQYNQQIYYGNVTESEALILSNKEALAGLCLSGYLHKTSGKDILQDSKDVTKLEDSMRNTKARDENVWSIDTKYFSWKVLGTGLSTYEENIACENGVF